MTAHPRRLNRNFFSCLDGVVFGELEIIEGRCHRARLACCRVVYLQREDAIFGARSSDEEAAAREERHGDESREDSLKGHGSLSVDSLRVFNDSGLVAQA